MEITVEMVERLREKAPVSYAQAKEALEYSEGNLLDALIYLEEKGAIPQAEGTRWSGREEKESQPTAAELVVQETPEPGKKKKHRSPLGVVVVWGAVGALGGSGLAAWGYGGRGWCRSAGGRGSGGRGGRFAWGLGG